MKGGHVSKRLNQSWGSKNVSAVQRRFKEGAYNPYRSQQEGAKKEESWEAEK